MMQGGDIGNAVMGSFVRHAGPSKPRMSSGACWRHLLDLVETVVHDMPDRYDTNEMFKLYNSAFDGVFNGNLVISRFAEARSPLLYTDAFSASADHDQKGKVGK
jgi:hypothetical protein